MFSRKLLHISLINYLNAAPFNYGLQNGLDNNHIKLHLQTPSMCADALNDGKVDMGLISSIEYLRIDNIKIIPKYCISSINRVNSVIILSKISPKKIKTLAIDRSSRTSAVLGQIILREKYGVYPKVIVMTPNQNDMLNCCDAAILIGDNAMKIKNNGLIVLDLSEEWYNLTRLPFVFAIWAIRETALHLDTKFNINNLIGKSLTIGRQNLDIIISKAQKDINWSYEDLSQYLTKNILYDLDKLALNGMRLFFKKAYKYGFATNNKPFMFLH